MCRLSCASFCKQHAPPASIQRCCYTCPSAPADEVHLLNESRGSSLEGVVARIKVVSRCAGRQSSLDGM